MRLSGRGSPRLRLAPEEFRLLRDMINVHFGLHFDDSGLYLFERRLADRVAALELSSFDEYYKYLRFNANGRRELEEAIETLTTKETYFFRQEYQLRAFQNELLPRIARANAASRQVSVWSAGCSTGEEAYTIAMLMLQSGTMYNWDMRVIGSDLSKNSVAFARRGVYRGASFRTMSEQLLNRYFTRAEGGYQVIDGVRRICHFGQLNLLDNVRASNVGRVDAIFCRNVLIYFDEQKKKRVIDTLYQRLVPGGYLLLGHSESLLNVSTAFELVHLKEDLVYRKPVISRQWDANR
ncbi:MAG TPA: protein-glutamate O-methyltransferase CheR [Polyangiaceae bacterium]|nr:protein-glutamate O-methyltransferase CheR [Polyangiaceae bacterium]